MLSQDRGQLCPDELLHLRALPLPQHVYLRQQQGDVRCVAAEVADQFDVALGQRGIHTHRHQGQPHVGEPIQGGLRVVGEDTVQPRRIHEADAPVGFHLGQFDAHPGDLLGIPRIVVL